MTTEPPDTCPICGAAQTPSLYQFVAGFITQIYDCGATFSGPLNVHPDTSWHSPCPHAMTAALRCIELLNRLRQWDMMSSADGPYWQAEIDKALRP